MRRVIPKFAFLVHEPTLYDHWKSLWQRLDSSEFEILLMDDFRHAGHSTFRRSAIGFINRITASGYKFRFVSDVIRHSLYYEFVISNHVVAGVTSQPDFSYVRESKNLLKRIINSAPSIARGGRIFQHQISRQYISMQLGRTPIRIMYGADISDGWSLASWNEQYKYILCHGPNDATAVHSRFNAKVFQIGYPRYDSFFKTDHSDTRNVFLTEFGLSPGRKTIVWLPTLGKGACSIPYYARHVSKLAARYNVVVRPHPISFREEAGNIRLLEKLKFKIDRSDAREMSTLYAAADFLLCDYGGTAFSALYLDRNIVQLNVPGAEEWYTSARSSNFDLRTLLDPVVSLNDVERLNTLFDDVAVWEQQSKQREVAFPKYFAPYRGKSAERTVDVLRNIRDIEIGSQHTTTSSRLRRRLRTTKSSSR